MGRLCNSAFIRLRSFAGITPYTLYDLSDIFFSGVIFVVNIVLKKDEFLI